jgi:hypothetical protein
LTTKTVADPSTVVLKQWGKDHINDESFDPSKLMETDKFGVAPSNTVLTITYRINSTGNVNAASSFIFRKNPEEPSRLHHKQDVLQFLRMFWSKHPDQVKNIIGPDSSRRKSSRAETFCGKSHAPGMLSSLFPLPRD